MGDGVLVEFASVVEAVNCGVAVQTVLAASGEASLIRLRIGITLGDVIADGEDIYGDGVNVAARLEAMAEPGGVLVSEDVQRQTVGRISAVFEAAGEKRLKNIPRPIRTWAWHPARSAMQDGRVGAGASAGRGAFALPDRPSIVVLPFENMSADSDHAYFSEGLTEDIVTNLARCRWLFVIGRNSSLRYRGGAADAQRAGQELGVRYVLDGSVRRSGDRLRVSCQLIEADGGAHLWAERYDRTLIDLFEMQDDITLNVVAVLEPTVKRAEIERVRRKRPEDLGAYELYLRALQHMYDVRAEGRARALAFAERALAADPDYAEAHGVAAWCYFARSLWEGSLPDPYKEAMLRHARAVQELPTDDASTLAHGAIALSLATREFQMAVSMIERAISSNPSSAHAYGHGSVINTWSGNYDLSIAFSDTALRLSPFDPLRVMPLAGQAGARLMMGDHGGALSFATQALQVYPTHTPSFLISVAALMRQGEVERAQVVARRLLEVSPSYRIIPRAPVLEHFVGELRAAGLPG
jgi:TolB-like protein